MSESGVEGEVFARGVSGGLDPISLSHKNPIVADVTYHDEHSEASSASSATAVQKAVEDRETAGNHVSVLLENLDERASELHHLLVEKSEIEPEFSYPKPSSVGSYVGSEVADADGCCSEPASPTTGGFGRLRRQPSKLKIKSTRNSIIMDKEDDDTTSPKMTSTALGLNIDNPGKVGDFYRLGKQIGKGAFGSVCKAAVKATGAVRAIKKIPLPAGKNREMMTDLLKRELHMGKICDHPNIVKLFEVFEDEKHLYLVLEYCRDQDLSCHVGKGLSITDAAVVLQQILRGVNYMHRHHIVHRDIKSENMLMSMKHQPPPTPTSKGLSLFKEKPRYSQYEGAVRITDFGLSCFFEEGEFLTLSCGTASHKSPQVFAHKYTHKCDIWSCGIIMYYALCGELPFQGHDEDIKAQITGGAKIKWSETWMKKPPDCLALVRTLLCVEEDRRPTAVEVLKKAWFTKNTPPNKTTGLSAPVITSLKGFRNLSKLKRVTLSVIASMLTDQSVGQGRDMFIKMDRDGDGVVTVKELREVLEIMNLKKTEIDDQTNAIFKVEDAKKVTNRALRNLRRSSSFEEDSKLPPFTYTEFLAATFDRQKYVTEATCRAAFFAFDKDASGLLDSSELLDGHLLGELTPEEIEDIIKDFDADGDGQLNFEEFYGLMAQSKLGSLRTFASEGSFSRICSEDAVQQLALAGS